MTRRLVAVLLGVVLVAGLGGCGIPQFSEVRVDGPGPVGEAGSVNGRPSEPPPRGASGSDSAAFVRNFLAAAAGEPNRAYDRVLQYVAPEDREQLRAKQGGDFAVNVVRLLDDPVTTVNPPSGEEATFSVRVTVQQVGLLRANGTLAPPVATETQYRFDLRGAAPAGSGDEDAGYYIVDPPSTLLLSDQALQMFYRPSTVYFWNSNQTRLVPDQRYLPLAVPRERRVTEVVGWLTDGPSEWLTPIATRLPDGARLINNATETDGRWEIDIAMTGEDGDKLDRLVTQLAWSLSEIDGPLELKVRNQTRRKVANLAQHRLDNPVYLVSQLPQRFCVYEGVVRPLAFLGETSGVDPVAEEDNRNVVAAGLSRVGDRVLAALVVADGRRQRLAVGAGVAPVRVTRSATTYTSIGRPVWLKTPDLRSAHGLVVADGRLHRFDTQAHLTPVPLVVPGTVTAVAAALDGHRIALVVGGRLYVAAVSVDGGGVTVGPTRQVPTSLTALTAVDWAGESRLVLSGAHGQPAVYEVSVDGAGAEVALRTDLGARVNHLVSYPDNPVVRFTRSPVMYEANRVTWAGPPLTQVLREQVQGVGPADADARPGSPTAPFFLY